jgi:tryptophanyl-tRNA synthetase
LNANEKAVRNQIRESSAETRKRAQKTMREVRELVGLPSLKI